MRTRLTYQQSRELRSVRSRHPSGLILRGARVLGPPRTCGARPLERRMGAPIDPPLEAGGTIEVDPWMPSEPDWNASR